PGGDVPELQFPLAAWITRAPARRTRRACQESTVGTEGDGVDPVAVLERVQTASAQPVEVVPLPAPVVGLARGGHALVKQKARPSHVIAKVFPFRQGDARLVQACLRLLPQGILGFAGGFLLIGPSLFCLRPLPLRLGAAARLAGSVLHSDES